MKNLTHLRAFRRLRKYRLPTIWILAGAVTSLNQGIALVLAAVYELQKQKVVKKNASTREAIEYWVYDLESLRAWANHELGMRLNEEAEEAWAYFDGLRRKWHRDRRDPDDLRIEAEHMARKMLEERDEARKRRQAAKAQRQKEAEAASHPETEQPEPQA